MLPQRILVPQAQQFMQISRLLSPVSWMCLGLRRQTTHRHPLSPPRSDLGCIVISIGRRIAVWQVIVGSSPRVVCPIDGGCSHDLSIDMNSFQ